MRFLADQDVYQATVEGLRSVGHDVVTAGVILLRITPGTMDDVQAELNRLLSAHSGEELRGQFCVVEPYRYRIRRIPPA